MPMTHARKVKANKKKARERRIEKNRNLLRNCAPVRFRLDVQFSPNNWTEGVKFFRRTETVKKYVDSIESDRKAGKEIIPGRIVNIVLGKIALEIPGTLPKGTLPDTISQGPKADPNVQAVAIATP
jgi:hypothetical protein